MITYYRQNDDIFRKLQEVEIDVSVEKNEYILEGKIDLLMGKDNKFEILDFKTMAKPLIADPIINAYSNQLCLYSYILKERYGKTAERLYIYWTSEKDRNDALMEFTFSKEQVTQAGNHFNDVVQRIRNRKFTVEKVPNYEKVCEDCDFRYYCTSAKIINPGKEHN